MRQFIQFVALGQALFTLVITTWIIRQYLKQVPHDPLARHICTVGLSYLLLTVGACIVLWAGVYPTRLGIGIRLVAFLLGDYSLIEIMRYRRHVPRR